MNYTAYGNTKSVPKRLARKHLRSEVFLANKKMKTLQRKAERANRKSLVEGEQNRVLLGDSGVMLE